MWHLKHVNEAGQSRARRWLLLAVGAVAVSGLFAILIALARVPALGSLFPGAEFYRVALTLHVNLSQGVWFMAFSGMLWSLGAAREHDFLERISWTLAVAGTFGMILSVSSGAVRPLMSNYLPVLDDALFLTALVVFGAGMLLKSLTVIAGLSASPVSRAHLLLELSARETVAVFALLAISWFGIEQAEGLAFFELLFWGAGHLWQFALLSLLMFCWIELAPKAAQRIPAGVQRSLFLLSALPVLLALGIPLLYGPETPEYGYLYTWLMRWTSWEAPLLLGLLLYLSGRGISPAPGFGLSLLLFVFGLFLGTQINGQTTLITAHYHGTIGAVTLAFMAASFSLLPALGIEAPSRPMVRAQLAFYGYGVLLMMAGLAGAGLMGAPRKTPGDLGMTFSVETISRICLGLGGLCATIGILMFAYLLIRRLFPASRKEVYSL
jgi:hypothetical protein